VLYVYDFCDGSAITVEKYRRRFAMRRIPDCTVFSKVFNILRKSGALSSISSNVLRELLEKIRSLFLNNYLNNFATTHSIFFFKSFEIEHMFINILLKMIDHLPEY